MNGGQTEEIKVDSCKTQEMIDAYANVKDATGLAGLLGSKYWPVGVSGESSLDGLGLTKTLSRTVQRTETVSPTLRSMAS
mgnify:CR=1 FL=1